MTYLTTAQAAERLKMCKKSLLRTDIPRVRFGRKILIREEDLDAWARSRLEYGCDSQSRPFDKLRAGRGGRRIMRIKQCGTPKVFTPGELQKISLGEAGRG